MSIIQILGLLLALSVAGNAWLGNSYLGARDERTEAIGARDQARGAAILCGESVQALNDAAVKREKEHGVEVAQAAASAAVLQRRAQLQLVTPATRPGDDCGSAGDRVNNWLKARAAP
jgi:hypothetical protein